ncbi:MAG: hypothetical protein F4Y50_14790 [Dehalococcoidia bacterium]|nr:hypothetical protein [Dehalococcoidia bacterium]
MKRPFTKVLVLAVFIFTASLVFAGQVAAQESQGLDVTVRNVTKGQPLTPPVVIVHNGSLVRLPEDPEAIMGFAALAESGDPSAFAAAVAEYEGVKSATIVPVEGPIPGGSEATVGSISAMPGDFVSVISMLACTNDAVAYGTAVVTQDGGGFAMSSGGVYDAGTEANDETSATVPCLGGAAAGLSEGLGEGMVVRHPGIEGKADLTKEMHGWDGPAMQIFVTPAGEAAPEAVDFGFTLENLTSGQPLTPPVVVVHDPNVDVFDYMSPDELDGIDDLAEGGVQVDLVATLNRTPGVVWVYGIDSGGPIIPGATYTEGKLYGVSGADVTLVSMFACTNDGYIRVTGGVMSSDGVVSFGGPATATVFDSGSEANDETMATIPCLGGPEAALSEGLGEGERSLHAGIVGNADLSKETHGWTEATTGRMTLHAVGMATNESPEPAPPATDDTPMVEELPEPAPPVTGDIAPGGVVLLATGVGGAVLIIAGEVFILASRRQRKEVIR